MIKVVISSSLLLAVFLMVWPKFQYSSLGNMEKLNFLIKQDLERLQASGHLPKAWSEISSLEVYGEKNHEHKWLTRLNLPIEFKPNGNRHLEVQVLPWKIEGQIGAVVNFHLFNRDDKNMIWEFGRTFNLSKETQ